MTPRFFYAATAVALMALACGAGEPQQAGSTLTTSSAAPPPRQLPGTSTGVALGEVTADADLELFRGAAADAPTPNQSYLVKQQEKLLAACMASMIHELGNSAWWVPGVWSNPGAVIHTPRDWRVTNQTFHYRSGITGDSGSYASVTFSNARWDPQHSAVSYGEKRVAQNVEINNDAKTKVIQNDSDTDVEVRYEEKEELTNRFATNITHGMTLDLDASSTTTVSGEYLGVKAQEAVTLKFGISTTDTESREQSEEGTSEQALEIVFSADAGHYYLVTISKEHRVTYQAFSIHGVMDFDIDIHMQQRGGRLASYYPGDHVALEGLAGLSQFVYGYDTNHPSMQGFYARSFSRTKNGIGCALDPGRRTLTVSGTNQASLESNADYRVESLGTSLPDHLQHLPVEHAGDYAGS